MIFGRLGLPVQTMFQTNGAKAAGARAAGARAAGLGTGGLTKNPRSGHQSQYFKVKTIAHWQAQNCMGIKLDDRYLKKKQFPS